MPVVTTTPASATARLAARAAGRPVWLVSLGAGVLAAIAAELYGLAARGAGVPMEAGNVGAPKAAPIETGMFATGVGTAVFWGTIIAVTCAWWSRRPARTYLIAALALTAVSLPFPLNAGGAATTTKLMLCGAHLLAAAIVIPLVTRRLARSPGRPSRREAPHSSPAPAPGPPEHPL